ncbi:MAG TPA: hypothetical protein VH054_00155 [Polyangiaceae bacterium]|nr:hypothetical protein [Polyangiaceae bacterium]
MKRACSVLFVVAAACGAQQPTSEMPSAGADWKELRVAWTYGPCPNDGRSCHQTLTVQPSGGFIASEMPNGGDAGPEPARRFSSLESQETLEMNRIVTHDFVAKLGSLPCSPGADANVMLTIDGHSQDVSSCALGDASSPVHDLVALLSRHRSATHDAPQTHAVVPTGAGDSCNVSTGCGKGLQCVASPCVVAPCTSGSCQKL